MCGILRSTETGRKECHPLLQVLQLPLELRISGPQLLSLSFQGIIFSLDPLRDTLDFDSLLHRAPLISLDLGFEFGDMRLFPLPECSL